MRIGIVALWGNRGQGLIARHLRDIFAGAGHEIHVLARPTKDGGPMPNHIDGRPEWQVPHLTLGSTNDMSAGEYIQWAKKTGVEVVFLFANRQFKAVHALRKERVRTVGWFAWERFSKRYAKPATKAYDVIYSLTKCEQAAYQAMGIDSPYVRFGVFPDIPSYECEKKDDAIYFIFHGGTQGPRKPIKLTVDAFKEVSNPNIRLIIKSQGVRRGDEQITIDDDPRIQHVVQDLSFDEYEAMFASCHVCLCPSRWEGLGVHLYESLGYNMPLISTDIAPINEVVTHGKSGLLARGIYLKKLRHGLKIYDPDPAELREYIEELSDLERIKQMSKGVAEEAERLNWNNTRDDYLDLAERALAGDA